MTERVTEAELVVLDALWQESPLTAAEVAARTVSERGWSLQTVKTLLTRLVAKKAVVFDVDGRRFSYRPLMERPAHAATESRRLLDRLFGGRAAPLVAHLAERGELSPEDVAEIEAIIAGLKA